jgi:hypothetical protein
MCIIAQKHTHIGNLHTVVFKLTALDSSSLASLHIEKESYDSQTSPMKEWNGFSAFSKDKRL